MPHVVVEEAGGLQGLYLAFTPMVQRTGNEIFKVQEFYLSRSRKDALVESVTIEQGTAHNFFVQLKADNNAITVRLLPATDPENPPAAKNMMALVARFIRTVYPGVARENQSSRILGATGRPGMDGGHLSRCVG